MAVRVENSDVIGVAITFEDGIVGVMSFPICEYTKPDGGEVRRARAPSKANIQSSIDRSRFPPERGAVVSWRKMTDEELLAHHARTTPTALWFRDGLRDDGRKIDYDMPACRLVHLKRLRAERGPMLDQLDRDWNRAAGQKKHADADAIEARRQALCDAPVTLAPAIEAAATLEELRAIKLSV